MRLFLTLTVFILTLILMLTRPRGLHEAWATCLGGSLMLLLGLETPVQAWHTTAQGADVLAFLLALMLLSGLLDRSGFFEWAALHAARAAKGNGEALFRNVFLLGAVVTALLSLDTTAIILTPVVLAFVGRLKLRARPFLLACAFVANTASLLLPVSNLTNLLFQSAFHFTFGAFVLRMALPQATALAVNYLVFRRLFRRELPQAFPTDDLPTPGSVLPDGPYFRGALVALACVLVGYFIGSLRGVPPCVVALAGCVGLAAWGVARHQVKWDVWRDVSWSLFPFVIGLFVVIRGVENWADPVRGSRIRRGGAGPAGCPLGVHLWDRSGKQRHQQRPDGPAGDLNAQGGTRGTLRTVRGASGVQLGAEPDPDWVARHHARHFGCPEEGRGCPGVRLLPGWAVDDAGDVTLCLPDALAGAEVVTAQGNCL